MVGCAPAHRSSPPHCSPLPSASPSSRFADDEPDQVSTDVETTTTTSTSESTSTSTTATSTSTTTTSTHGAGHHVAAGHGAVHVTTRHLTAGDHPAASPAPASPAVEPADRHRHRSRAGCLVAVRLPVGPQDLRRITVTHRGFDGRDHTGHLIVHEDWADELLGVFDAIHAAGFAIQRIQPVDAFGASDDASMAANNTSAFNCRAVTGGTGWSRHSFGRAIDINPIQNPYVIDRRAARCCLPPAARPTVDRSPRQGVITAGDAVVSAFAGIGWQWGGNWTSPVDYQHFDHS